jgi:hypothetical protein
MKRTCILLVGLILLSAVPCRATTNLIVRWIQQHTDVSTAKTEPETISFYRGESVRYTVYAKYKNSGVDLSAPGVFLAWYAAPQTNNSILYVCTTGIVVNASNGVCQFDLSSTEGVIPTNTYDSWVAAYRTNTGGATLQLGTMSRSVLKVLGSVYDGTVTNAPVYLNGWATTGSVIVLSNLVVSSYATTGSVMAVSNALNSTASLVRAYADTQVNGTATLLRAYADSLHAVATGQVAAVSGLVVTATAIAQGAANSNATLKTQYETSSNLLGLVVASNATLKTQYGGTSNLLDLTTGSGAVTRVIAQGAADTGAVALAQIAAVSNCVDALEGQTNDYLRRDGTLPMTGNLSMGSNMVTSVAHISMLSNYPTTISNVSELAGQTGFGGEHAGLLFFNNYGYLRGTGAAGGESSNILCWYLADGGVVDFLGSALINVKPDSIYFTDGTSISAGGVLNWNDATGAVKVLQTRTQTWEKAATDAQTATGQVGVVSGLVVTARTIAQGAADSGAVTRVMATGLTGTQETHAIQIGLASNRAQGASNQADQAFSFAIGGSNVAASAYTFGTNSMQKQGGAWNAQNLSITNIGTGSLVFAGGQATVSVLRVQSWDTWPTSCAARIGQQDTQTWGQVTTHATTLTSLRDQIDRVERQNIIQEWNIAWAGGWAVPEPAYEEGWIVDFATTNRISGESSNYTWSASKVDWTTVLTITTNSALLHFDGAGTSIVESAHSLGAYAYNGAQQQTDTQKWTAAIILDGSDDYVYVDDSDYFDCGTDPFTLDFWMYDMDSGNAYAAAVGASGEGGGWRSGCLCIQHATHDGVENRVKFHDCAYSWSGIAVFSQNSISDGAWHHVALVRESAAVLRLYVDGVLEGSCVDFNVSVDFSFGGHFTVGGGNWDEGAGYWAGCIDEVRLAKGVALWTKNFTPPTTPHTVVTTNGMTAAMSLKLTQIPVTNTPVAMNVVLAVNAAATNFSVAVSCGSVTNALPLTQVGSAGITNATVYGCNWTNVAGWSTNPAIRVTGTNAGTLYRVGAQTRSH